MSITDIGMLVLVMMLGVDEAVGEHGMQEIDQEGTESGIGKDGVEHANADGNANGNADEKLRESIDGGEDESVNNRMDDGDSVGTDGCAIKGGETQMLIQTMERAV